MKTLCLDTAHKYLVIGLYEDAKFINGCANISWKKQSETLFPELIRLCEESNWDSDDIDEVVITDGPGSYTGVRIAMSVAKVLCTRKQLPLYAISTLQLYAGCAKHAFVMLDARSQRAYVGELKDGSFVEQECILTLDEIKDKLSTMGEVSLFGDCELINEVACTPSVLENFIALRPLARRIENIHTLTPRYLKDQDAYKVQ